MPPTDRSGDSIARRAIRTLSKFLSNRKTAQGALAALGAVIAIALLPLQFLGVSGASGSAAPSSPAFVLAYALVAVSIIACETPRISSMLRRLTRVATEPPKAAGSSVTSTATLSAAEAARTLGALGYRRLAFNDDAAWGVRNGWAPIGDLLFHFGILIVMAASLASATVARHESTHAYPIQPVEPRTGAKSAQATSANQIVRGYELRSVRAFMDGKVVTDLRAVVADDAGTPRVIEPGLPLFIGPDRLLFVDGWGYAADLSISGTESITQSTPTTVRLPARHDPETTKPIITTTASGTYRITLSIDDSRLGLPVGRPKLHSAKAPQIRVTVGVRETDGTYRSIALDTPLSQGRALKVGGIVVRLQGQRPYASMRTIESWSILPMIFGLASILAGLVWRLAIGRKDAVVSLRPTGCVVAVKADAYRSADAEAERLRRALEGR